MLYLIKNSFSKGPLEYFSCFSWNMYLCSTSRLSLTHLNSSEDSSFICSESFSSQSLTSSDGIGTNTTSCLTDHDEYVASYLRNECHTDYESIPNEKKRLVYNKVFRMTPCVFWPELSFFETRTGIGPKCCIFTQNKNKNTEYP
jgi:hypothetical protein